VIRLHNQQSNNFREKQQQNTEWSGLSCYVCSCNAFPVGAPVKVCTTRLRGLRDSPHWQGCGCWPATLPSSSSSSELLVEKSGLEGGFEQEDCREGGRGSSSSCVPDVRYSPSSLSKSIMISCISFWGSGRAHFARETSPCCLLENNLMHLPRPTAKSQLREDKHLQGS
jgi:hypothetical protein